MAGYCEPSDVRKALQETSSSFGSGALGTEIVTAAIEGVSDWLHRRSHHHWYDSSGTASDLVPTTAKTATNVRLDVPSSPYRQDHQLLSDEQDVRYPVTHNGPYAKIRLPHYNVTSLQTLEVRNLGGGVQDWVASSDHVEGRGEDYYVQVDGGNDTQTTYLYIRAASIGARIDYNGLLTLDYDYGTDAAASGESWEDVRRGVAQLAAAQVVSDDDVLTAIPNDGQLIGVDTQVQQLLDRGRTALEPYLEVPTA